MRALPEVRTQVEHLLAEVADATGQLPTADVAEDAVVARIRQLGLAALQAWAQRRHEELAVRPAGARKGLKKVRWLTSVGALLIVEQTWRRGSHLVRPFCASAQVRSRRFSRCLQRIVVDFGSDGSFVTAAAKVREHYDLLVAAEQIRQHCWRIAGPLAASTDTAAAHTTLRAQGPAWIVAEADGSMVPLVTTTAAPPGTDRRKHRRLSYQEARLVAARAQGSATTCYDATLGDVADAGRRWSRVMGAAGWAVATRIHGLGDGAPWIVEQCGSRFGGCARYTLDLFHACDERFAYGESADYLAAAAPDPTAAADFVRVHRAARPFAPAAAPR